MNSDALLAIRLRDVTAQAFASANQRQLSAAQVDRRDLLRELDRVVALELDKARHAEWAELFPRTPESGSRA